MMEPSVDKAPAASTAAEKEPKSRWFRIAFLIGLVLISMAVGAGGYWAVDHFCFSSDSSTVLTTATAAPVTERPLRDLDRIMELLRGIQERFHREHLSTLAPPATTSPLGEDVLSSLIQELLDWGYQDNSSNSTNATLDSSNSTSFDLLPLNTTIAPGTDPVAGSVAKLEKPRPTAEQLRLPKYVQPVSYDLSVKIYLPGYEAAIAEDKKLKFDGNVKINMNLSQKSNKIVLNSDDIAFNQDKCRLSERGTPVKIVNIIPEADFRKATFVLEREVEGSNIVLEISYIGIINDNLKGLYRSTYVNTKNEIKTVAVTQMEPEDARLFVPCFDEPEYRATWNVTVIHPKGTSALSNGMESKPVDAGDNFLSTSFKTTPPMSSYLLAVFVSDFQKIEGTFSGKPMRIWSRPEMTHMTRYALDAGKKVTEYYEKMYGIDFPMDKQDMVALPDFASGAMENWGLITYREDALLYNNVTYTMGSKKGVAVTIAHELAHQWFGNLVTLKWWDDLWLNEGFATYVEAIGTNQISEHLGGEEHAINHLKHALGADALATSHPCSFKAETVEEVQESFDTISYAKGGSVIRMIKYVMGEENFNSGIKDYLNQYKYKNAMSIDLWTVLNNHTSGTSQLGPDGQRLNVTELALQWTSQMGYPVLNVETVGADLKVTATRFKKNENAKELEKYANPKYGFQWDVPVWYQIAGEKDTFIWIPRGKSAIIPGAADKAIIMNSGIRSFVRANYDENGWDKIIKALETDINLFSNLSRSIVLTDAFEMASVNKLSYEKIFKLTSYGKKETDNLPLSVILGGLRSIGRRLGTEPESKVYQKYLRKIMEPSYKNISLEEIAANDSKEEKKKENDYKLTVFGSYCSTKAPDCLTKLQKLFDEKVKTPCSEPSSIASKCSKVTPALRATAYCYGIRYGDEKIFNLMKDLYQRETDAQEQATLMSALPCTYDITILKSLLHMSLDRNSTVFRMQDSIRVIYASVAGHSIGEEFILNHFMQNWDEIYEKFHNTKYINDIIRTSMYIRNQLDLDQVKRFLAEAKHVDKYHQFKKSIEGAEYSLDWKKKNFAKVTEIMEKELAA